MTKQKNEKGAALKKAAEDTQALESKIKDLKAQAYNLIRFVEQGQNALKEVNNQIAVLEQKQRKPVEPPSKPPSKPAKA